MERKPYGSKTQNFHDFGEKPTDPGLNTLSTTDALPKPKGSPDDDIFSNFPKTEMGPRTRRTESKPRKNPEDIFSFKPKKKKKGAKFMDRFSKAITRDKKLFK